MADETWPPAHLRRNRAGLDTIAGAVARNGEESWGTGEAGWRGDMGRSRSFAAGVLVLCLSGCAESSEPTSVESPSETATESLSPSTTAGSIPTIPMEEGPPLEPGTYRVSSEGRTGSDPIVWSIVDFTIDIPEGLIGHTGHYLETTEDFEGGASFGFYPVLVDEIYADPCEGERGSTVPLGPEPNDLVEALLAQPGTATASPVETVVGGLPAMRVDLVVPEGADLGACHLADYGPPGLQIWFSKPTGKFFVLSPDLHARVYVVDVEGRRQVFLAVHDVEASAEDLAGLESMINSIRID